MRGRELSALLLVLFLLLNFICKALAKISRIALWTLAGQQPNFPACLVVGQALFTKLTVKLLCSTLVSLNMWKFISDTLYIDRRINFHMCSVLWDIHLQSISLQQCWIFSYASLLFCVAQLNCIYSTTTEAFPNVCFKLDFFGDGTGCSIWWTPARLQVTRENKRGLCDSVKSAEIWARV